MSPKVVSILKLFSIASCYAPFAWHWLIIVKWHREQPCKNTFAIELNWYLNRNWGVDRICLYRSAAPHASHWLIVELHNVLHREQALHTSANIDWHPALPKLIELNKTSNIQKVKHWPTPCSQNWLNSSIRYPPISHSSHSALLIYAGSKSVMAQNYKEAEKRKKCCQ